MRPVRTLLAAAVMVAATFATPAGAATQLTGTACSLGTAEDPQLEGSSTGVVSGGPLAAPGSTIEITCTVQSSAPHAGADLASVTSPRTTGAAVLAATVTFVVFDEIYVCTAATTNTGGFMEWQYWDAPSATWSTDPFTARCDPSVTVQSSVGGGIGIVRSAASAAPVVTLTGVLAAPALFACDTSYGPGQPVVVSCVPEPAMQYTWYCSGLGVSAATLSPGGLARARLDCDADSVAEARTAAVSGAGGHDSAATLTDVTVAAFTCTADDGAGGAPLPEAHLFCGDPGAARAG